MREKNILPSLGGICVHFTSAGKPHMNNLNFICIHGIISHFMHFNALEAEFQMKHQEVCIILCIHD